MSLFLLVLLVISKLYYFSTFSLGVYNFTLSDICIIFFVIQILFPIGKKYYRDANVLVNIKKLMLISIGVACLNCLTTIIIGSVLTSTIMNIIKRWLSMLIIPIYIYKCVSPDKRKKLTIWVIITICIYTLMNIKSIISADALRYTAEGTANPNIIAGLFGLLFIYMINSEYKIQTKASIMLLSVFMILACSSRGGVVAVVITLFYLLCTSNIRIGKKIGIIFGSIAILTIGVVLGNIFLPTATDRIVDSFVGGISETDSFQSRTSTMGKLILMMFRNIELLFLGTGFGNGNLQSVASRYGHLITTADNMYGDLFAWCGLFGLPLIFMFFMILLKLCGKPSRANPNSMLLITIYMLALGFTQDSLFEPTVGCLYYILFGLEIIRSVDSKSIKEM